MTGKKIIKRTISTLGVLFILFLVLLIALFFAIRSPKIQTFIAQKVTQSLSKQINGDVTIDDISIEFFNEIKMNNVLVKDVKQDTVAYIGNVQANFSYFSLFKKKINLNQIQISDVDVNLNRAFNDTTFNFAQLIPIKETADSIGPTALAKPWEIGFETFFVKNVSFSQNDKLKGSHFTVEVPEMNGSFKNFDINNKILALDYVNIDAPVINIISRAGNDSIDIASKPFHLDIPYQIEADEVNISNGLFAMENEQLDKENLYRLLSFNRIQINLTDAYIKNDSIYTSLNKLIAKEANGFEINKLESEISLTNNIIELNKLQSTTSNSYIGDYAKLSFDSFDDFSNFTEDVRFEADFKNTSISPKDIAYFTQVDLSGFRYPIEIDGRISGKVENLKGRDIILKTGQSTVLEGKFSLRGLPKVKETFISFDLKRLLTDYKDITGIYPKLKLPENFEKMGRIFFTGKFDGFVNDFVTYGKLQTELGEAATDVNFKLAENGTSSYTGNFSMTDFRVGEWLGIDEKLGAVTLTSNVEGKGLKLNTLDATLAGNIASVELNGYVYKNLTIDGSLKNKFFQGNAEINDENIQFDFTGLIDATNLVPRFEFVADIKKANLQALNLLNQSYTLSGKMNTNFAASNIDDVLGELHIDDLAIEKDDKIFTLNRIAIQSNLLSNGEKQITVLTDNIEANAEGIFILSEVPKAIKKIVLPYDNSIVTPQEIRWDFKLNNNSELLALFVPDLKLPKSASIGGNLNTANESLFAVIDLPFVQYNSVSAAKFNANILITENGVDILSSLPKVYLGDSIFLEDISLLAEGTRNDIDIRFNAITPTKNTSVRVDALLQNRNKEYTLSFDPSKLMFNETFWEFADNNKINFGSAGVLSENLKIVSGNSALKVGLAVNKENAEVITELNNIQLNDFMDFLEQKNINLRGLANGKVVMRDFLENPIFGGNLIVDSIEINQYSVGRLAAKADVDLPSKKVIIKGNLSGNENDIDIDGTYSFSPTSTPRDLDIGFTVNQFAIKSIEDFIAEYIDNTVGTVTGEVRLLGPRNKPQLYGYIDVNDVTTTVTYLQTSYNVKNQRVLFEKNAINLGSNLRVTDMDGNEAFGTGKITHNALKDIALDINVVSEKVMGLNTTREDNELFYGKAYLKGGVSFIGPANDISIFVYGESEPSTLIEVPLDDTDQSSEYTFYTFIDKAKDEDLTLIESVAIDEEAIRIKGVNVKLDLVIDQDCEVRLILDQAAGDVLEAKGEGNITIDVAKGGDDVDFYGNYLITDGNYLFTLQSIINKKFRIEPNSTIKFNGPIEQAVIDVNAIYNLRSSTTALVQDILTESEEEKIADAKNRVPVKLYLNLTDRLSEPTIKFDIQVTQLDPNIRNEVETKLQNIRLYENELNRQVFGLLVLGQFLPSSVGLEVPGGNNNLVVSSAANTVSEFFSNQISRYFTDLISTVIPGMDLNFNYSSYNQNDAEVTDEEALQNRRELQLLVSQRFLNDRITLNFGGNIDFGEDNLNPGSNATFLGGDFSFEYAFTKSRQFRMKAFTTTDYDYFSENNRTRAGLGLSYKKEFDKIKEWKLTKDDFKLRNQPKIANDSIDINNPPSPPQ